MSDRIILMRKGKIEQEGPPTAIFDRPVSAFAARFMGVENCFEGELIELSGGQAQVQVGERRLRGRWSGRSIPKVGAKVAVGVRAERLHLGPVAPTAPDHNVLPCGAGGAIYKGKYLDRTVTTDIAPIKVRIWNASAVTDQPSRVWWHKDDCIVMDL